MKMSNIDEGKKIYAGMAWLHQSPREERKERESLRGEESEPLLKAAFGDAEYRLDHLDGYVPPQNGMGVVLDSGGYYERKSVIHSRSLEGLRGLLEIWGATFEKDVTSDGEIQKWSCGILRTFPDSRGEYAMTVR